MNRFIKSLARKLSRPKAPVAADQPCNAVSAEDVLMPDIYTVMNVDTVPDLVILDSSTPDTDESAGLPIWTAKRPELCEGEDQGWSESKRASVLGAAGGSKTRRSPKGDLSQSGG